MISNVRFNKLFIQKIICCIIAFPTFSLIFPQNSLLFTFILYNIWCFVVFIFASTEFHFYRNILFKYIHLCFSLSVCCLHFLLELEQQQHQRQKNILSAGILDSVFMLFAIEMECIVRLGRCSAERISVFDYLHKISNKNREKKEAACHGAATTGCSLLSHSHGLSFSLHLAICYFHFAAHLVLFSFASFHSEVFQVASLHFYCIR